MEAGFFFFIAVGVFVALLFLRVESWSSRVTLAALVAGVYYFLGFLLTMPVIAVLSIGILLKDYLPLQTR